MTQAASAAMRVDPPPGEISQHATRTQLARIVGSRTFENAPVLRRFLEHVVDCVLTHRSDQLKEYALGVDVFGRGPSFDPRVDTIVRVQARRLRVKLDAYYRSEGCGDPIVIELPKGHYVPRLHAVDQVRSALEPSAAAPVSRSFSSSSRRLWPLALASLTAVIAVLAWLAAGTDRSFDPVAIGASGRPAIAIMPFDRIGDDAELEWMSEGLPNLVLTGLAETPGLDVFSLDRLRQSASRLERGIEGGMKSESWLAAARRAGAGAVLRGTILSVGGEIRIDARVEDVDRGRVLAVARVTGADVFALADELIPRIRDALGVTGEGADLGIERITTRSLEAYRLYSEGRAALNQVRWDDARDLFQEAVRLDPSFAMAYFYLSHTRERVGEQGSNRTYRERVLKQMHRLPERLRLLVLAAHYSMPPNRDVKRAVDLYERLMARYPDEEEAYIHLAMLYTGEAGDPRRGLEVITRGMNALPTSDLYNELGYSLLANDRYEEALAAFERHAALNPREPNPHDSLGEAYLVMGDPLKALEKFRLAISIDPSSGSRETLSWTLAVLGRYDEALTEIIRYQKLLIARDLPIAGPAYHEAFLLSRIGRYREARVRLDAALTRAKMVDRPSDLIGLYIVSALLALEQQATAAALADVASAERLLDRIAPDASDWLSQKGRLLVNFVAGMAAVHANDSTGAHRRLRRLESMYRPHDPIEQWWYHTLEGEIALSAGRLDAAETAFRAAQPRRKVDYGWGPQRAPFLQLFRDGLARVRAARGDLAGAIDIHHSLLTPGIENPWTPVLEPRQLLEVARLLTRAGDLAAARGQAQRIVELWKDADPDLPELAEAKRFARGVTAARSARGSPPPPAQGSPSAFQAAVRALAAVSR
jgi:tetratricopeptide (TPR) repeat protein